jgi:hypothetical protein
MAGLIGSTVEAPMPDLISIGVQVLTDTQAPIIAGLLLGVGLTVYLARAAVRREASRTPPPDPIEAVLLDLRRDQQTQARQIERIAEQAHATHTAVTLLTELIKWQRRPE